MPLFTTVIDDRSPLILYDATWIPETQATYAADYYRGTHTTNNITGGTVTFNFNGTAVWIYGANRPNHGTYTVQVDGNTYGGYNGSGNYLFQQSLFNISSLNQGPHTIELINTGSGSYYYVDIDMIVWQSQVTETSEQLVTETVQDTDSRFQYQEPAWSATSSAINLNLFSNGTGHVTQAYNASVTFMFTVSFLEIFSVYMTHPPHRACEAVSLFGISGPSNGPYSVQLDGGQPVEYNASNAYPTNYEVMIYHADNLGPGMHQVLLTNLPATSGEFLAIDHTVLWTIANSTSALTPSSDDISRMKLSSGAIAGIVVATVAAVLGLGAALFFYHRWKAAMATQHDPNRNNTLQKRVLQSAAIPPTGFSSSLETRGNARLFRNETTPHALLERGQQPDNNHATQRSGVIHVISGSHDPSTSVIDTVNSPAQSSADDSLRRPLPEAPGGGLSLSDEFPKLANPRPRQSIVTTNRSSVAVSEAPPPNYTQATGNASVVQE